jgi:hypothetical protein
MLTLRTRLYMYPRPLAFTSAIVTQGQSNTDNNDSNPCDWSEKAGHAGFSGLSRLRPQKRTRQIPSNPMIKTLYSDHAKLSHIP